MSKDYQQQIDEIMDNFDFDRVHKMMVAVDWKWGSGEDAAVPDKVKLRQTARYLLQRVVSDELYGLCTGGFFARNRNGLLSLSFGEFYDVDAEDAQ